MTKLIVISGFVALASAAILPAQEQPQTPVPAKEQQWLNQLAGDWACDIELYFQPYKPLRCKGTRSARMVGPFWLVEDGKTNIAGTPFASVLTVGFDPQKKKFVGTWIENTSSFMRKYEGSLDPSGKSMTLECEVPAPHVPGKLAKFKEVFDFKSNDHVIVTTTWQPEEGKWSTLAVVNCRRK
jgi:hypothetical protein